MMKAELRKLYKAKRLLLSSPEKRKLTDLILINFQRLHLPFIRYVHTYLAVNDKNETDTRQILGYLKFRNPDIQVCVPKILAKTGQMENFIYEEKMEMSVNKFGLQEPVHGKRIAAHQIDLVLTPLLAFDKKGNRVGFGKGFYDKFFSECRGDVIKAGLSFFEAEEIIEDADQFDIPLNYCVTPEKVYRFL